MSMTKEEAILLSAYTGVLLVPDFSDVHKFCEDTLGRTIWTHEFADQDVQKEIREKLRPQIMELVQNIAALRPVTREQVEKMRGEWTTDGVCSRCGFDAMYYKGVPVQVRTNYCPTCGSPMTDKAVDMVMKRLEELRGEKG